MDLVRLSRKSGLLSVDEHIFRLIFYSYSSVPTTSGTGSETTGVAVLDYMPLKAKVGIANRALRPMLGLVDPQHTKHMPERVAVFCG